MPNLNLINRTQPSQVGGPFYSRRQAAEYLGLSERTLEKRFQHGDGPVANRVGRRILYSVPALDAWMASRATKSTSDIQKGAQ